MQAATPTPRFRHFSVNVAGFEPFTLGALSRGKALAEAFSRFSEAYPDVTFREFLVKARVISCDAPAADGYDYVRRNYGVDVQLGQRVRLKDEGAASGREGEVVYPGTSTAHIHILLDGELRTSRVHPLNIEAA